MAPQRIGTAPQGRIARFFGFALAAALVLACVGCSPQGPALSEEEQQARSYMSEVNAVVDEVSDKLDGFDEAVADGNIYTMRAQADGAFAALDKLNAIEAPDAFKEVQDDYQKGCSNLKDALNGYLTLYDEISTATPERPFDYSTYDSRLQQLQDAYNTGIGALQDADKKASEAK